MKGVIRIHVKILIIIAIIAVLILPGCSTLSVSTVRDFAVDLATSFNGKSNVEAGQEADREPNHSPDTPVQTAGPNSQDGVISPEQSMSDGPEGQVGSDDSQNIPTPDNNDSDATKDSPTEPEPPAGQDTEPRDPQIVRPFYTMGGEPPLAPGLIMQTRHFVTEPEKIVYLTIDDGPHPSTTPKIIEILTQEQVPATFFVIGRLAEKYPELIKAEYEAGFAIGNHSYSHDYQEIYQSPQAFLQSIKQTEAVLEEIIGKAPKIIRAPGGTQTHFDIEYYNLLDAQGYLVYDWNVSIGDTAAPLVPTKNLLANLYQQMPGKNRAIILMHDAGGKSTTVEALPEIIKYLKQNGYSFGVLSPEVMPIVFPGGFSQ